MFMKMQSKNISFRIRRHGLISHYAIITFRDTKQLSLFLPVVYLGNLAGVSKFCDSAYVNIFIIINTVIFVSTSVRRSKIGRVMRPRLISSNLSISDKQLRRCPSELKGSVIGLGQYESATLNVPLLTEMYEAVHKKSTLAGS